MPSAATPRSHGSGGVTRHVSHTHVSGGYTTPSDCTPALHLIAFCDRPCVSSVVRLLSCLACPRPERRPSQVRLGHPPRAAHPRTPLRVHPLPPLPRHEWSVMAAGYKSLVPLEPHHLPLRPPIPPSPRGSAPASLRHRRRLLLIRRGTSNTQSQPNRRTEAPLGRRRVRRTTTRRASCCSCRSSSPTS